MSSTSGGSLMERIKRMFNRDVSDVGSVADRAEPDATPPPGASSSREGDPDRETSTNAQTEGAADQPWSGNT